MIKLLKFNQYRPNAKSSKDFHKNNKNTLRKLPCNFALSMEGLYGVTPKRLQNCNAEKVIFLNGLGVTSIEKNGEVFGKN